MMIRGCPSLRLVPRTRDGPVQTRLSPPNSGRSWNAAAATQPPPSALCGLLTVAAGRKDGTLSVRHRNVLLWWPSRGVPVGVLFDYFRASDTSTAAAVLERLGGPRDPDAPVMDAVAGKGFEPEVMMRRLQSLLAGVPYDQLPEGELLAMEGEDGPWIEQLSEELRDALADAQVSRLPAVAEQWVRTEEFWDGASAAEVLPFPG